MLASRVYLHVKLALDTPAALCALAGQAVRLECILVELEQAEGGFGAVDGRKLELS